MSTSPPSSQPKTFAEQGRRTQNLKSLFTNNQLLITYLLLALLITTYILYFSWYTLNRHTSLNSYAADLSLIDQPMWNTVLGPGGFMELTWGDHQQPRLAEHFEPILILLALLFFIWDDVRIILIAQTIALALGALPVFWIAGYQLTISNNQLTTPKPHIPHRKSHIANPTSHIPHPTSQNWAALAFAAAYLLYPHLQAANIADVHADPFVVTPLLFAFWYATQKRWVWMWAWAVMAMLTKENLPTLTAMLGLWLLLTALLQSKMTADHGRLTAVFSAVGGQRSAVAQGLLLLTISTAWFLIATFLIVAPLAGQYFGTDGPIYLANRFGGDSIHFRQMLQDPARWRYLMGLLAAVGFLPLLAPDMLILGLPVLIANFFSRFPGQYSGEQHYSAPLVAVFVIAAIYGARRLLNSISLREVDGQPLRTSALIGICLWLLFWSLSYHARYGWTPLSTRVEHYPISPAAIHLADFLALIPPEAAISASPGIHPHLAHRRVAYIFPIVEDADYLLVDVTDISGVHPNDVYTQISDLLNTNWRILQADHGLLLAQKSTGNQYTPVALPDSFFDFARTAPRAEAAPMFPASLTFGDDQLHLLGYTIHDDPDDGVSFQFYWQATKPLPAELKLWPLIYTDQGRLLSDPTQVPMIATVWYPPEAWPPGEIIVTETLPQLLPNAFHLGMAVGHTTASFYDTMQRWPVAAQAANSDRPPQEKIQPGHWAQLATFTRQGPFLTHLPPAANSQSITPVEAQFGPAIRLTGYWLDTRDSTLALVLAWQAEASPPTDYTVFVHLLAPDGTLAAQSDAYPTWLTPQPTSQWPVKQTILDSHTLGLPPDLPPGAYMLHLGLYNAQTMDRLALPDGRNALELTQIQIE